MLGRDENFLEQLLATLGTWLRNSVLWLFFNLCGIFKFYLKPGHSMLSECCPLVFHVSNTRI